MVTLVTLTDLLERIWPRAFESRDKCNLSFDKLISLLGISKVNFDDLVSHVISMRNTKQEQYEMRLVYFFPNTNLGYQMDCWRLFVSLEGADKKAEIVHERQLWKILYQIILVLTIRKYRRKIAHLIFHDPIFDTVT